MRRFRNNAREQWFRKKHGDEKYEIRTIEWIFAKTTETVEEVENDMRLSVLICTIPERFEEFEKLFTKLERQWMSLPFAIARRIEIIAISDDRKMTIGEKRNLLLDHSCGKYVCYIDDDDDISEMYLMKLWGGTITDPDAIGFIIKCMNYPSKGESKLADVGIKKKWYEDNYRIYRPPYHKTPVRASIAKAARFPDKSYGEDAEYASRITPDIENVYFIPEVLYIYNAPVNPSPKRYQQR